MNEKERLSEEQLNAFIDGELDAEEASSVFEQCESSSELDARVCQQRKLKELMQHAYRDLPEPNYHPARPVGRRRGFLAAAAALLLLVTGVAGGWFLSASMNPGNDPTILAAGPIPTAQAQSDSWLLHVTSSDPVQMRRALDQADELMLGSRPGHERHVEIVANEAGIDLLRSDVTPYEKRIRELARENVLFFACSRTIDRLREKGVDVKLVPQADSHYKAIDRVVLRLREGWNYVKI